MVGITSVVPFIKCFFLQKTETLLLIFKFILNAFFTWINVCVVSTVFLGDNPQSFLGKLCEDRVEKKLVT